MARPSTSRQNLPTAPPPPPRPTVGPNPPPRSTSRPPPTSAAPRPTSALPPPPPPPPPPVATTTTRSSAIRTIPPARTTTLNIGNARSGDSGGDGIGGGAIAGLAVGVLAVLIGSIVGGFMLLKQRRKRLMHVGKNNRRNSGYPESDPHRLSMSNQHSRRRYDHGDGYGGGGYYGNDPLPSSSSRARRAEGSTGIYDEKSFHAAKAGVGGPRLLPGSNGSTASLGRDAGGHEDRYSQYNNGRYAGTGRRTGGGGNGEGGYYPPFAPGAPGMLDAMPGDHRDSRTQSVVLSSRQLERERELDLQQQARMLSMADAENQLRPMSEAVLKKQAGGPYNQHSHYSQKQPPMQQYYYDDGYGNYGEYEGEYDGQYGEYEDGYYNTQWGPGPQNTAYGMESNSQQSQNPYGSQNPYPKAEGYTQQQQQQQGSSPSPRKSRDNVRVAGQVEGQAFVDRGPTTAGMSNASAVSGSESMVHSPTTAGASPVGEIMPSMGTDFVMSRQELLQQQLLQQQLYQQQQQQVYNMSGHIDCGDDAAEGKEEYRLSVHADGKKSSGNDNGGKEEYRLSQHGNGYQVPGTPIPASAVAADVMATAEAGVGATPPPLPTFTKPKKSLQSMRG
ncbi:hypothetical protein BGZ72_004870 [Mortierella alpina]|nr:hypothetical protein BGZ72_004870 [Mortierella alpina]